MKLREIIKSIFVALLISNSAASASTGDLQIQSPHIHTEPVKLEIDKFMEQAQLSFDSGNYDEAERSLRNALAISPNNSLILFDLSAVILASNRLVFSKVLFERTIKLSPERAEAYFFLGTINERLLNYSKAQEYYRQFAQKFPPAYIDRRQSAGPEYCGKLVHYLRPRLSSQEFGILYERFEHSYLHHSQPIHIRYFALLAQANPEAVDSGFPSPKFVMPFPRPLFTGNKQLIVSPEYPAHISCL